MNRATLLIFTVVIAVFVMMTRQRNEVWRDSLVLWQDAAAKSPLKARPLNNLGLEYRRRGDIERAIYYFSQAAAATSGPTYVNDMARANLAWMHFGAGQLQVAIDILNGIMAERPSLEVMNMLAVMALADGSPSEALRLTGDILWANESWQASASLHLTRGQAFQALGLCVEANREYALVQQLHPGQPVPSCPIQQ